MARLIAPLALVLAAACGQSPFDSRTGDQARDAGGGDGPPDAGVFACPTPCAGELDGLTDAWQYRVDERAPNGATYTALVEAVVAEAPAFAGTADGALPAVIDCADHEDGVCAGAGGRVVLVTTPTGDPAGDPVVAFPLPRAGRYRVSGTAEQLPGGDAAMKVLISRRSRNDLLGIVSLSGGEAAIDATLDAVDGDLVLLTVVPEQPGTPRPVAVRLFVSSVEGALAPTCQLSMTFDDPAPLIDGCAGRVFADQGSPAAAFVADGPNADYGDALHLDLGAWIDAPDAIDYDTDSFTLQAWLRFAGPPTVDRGPAYSDWQCHPASLGQGGVSVSHTGSNVVFAYAYDGSGAKDLCASWPELRVTEPEDAAWHHYRFVRDTARGEVYVCLDGIEVGAAPLANALSMLSGFEPTFGKDADFGAAGYEDDVDDFRVVKRALPCLGNGL